MKKLLAVLLLCALTLLSACGKKHAEPAGSGSAEETVEAQTKQDAKKTGKNTKNSKETVAPDASAAPTNGKSGSKTSGGKTDPAATPTPKIETWEDLEAFQQQMTELIAVNPVGNWIDKSTGAAMVIDEDFHGSILLAQADGSTVFWTFTVPLPAFLSSKQNKVRRIRKRREFASRHFFCASIQTPYGGPLGPP